MGDAYAQGYGIHDFDEITDVLEDVHDKKEEEPVEDTDTLEEEDDEDIDNFEADYDIDEFEE